MIVILWAMLCVSCKQAELPQVDVQKPQVLSKADSLWIANDFDEMGSDQYSYEDWDKGLMYFDSALKYNPEHSQAWHGRALMLDHFDRDAEAEIAYQNAEKFDAHNKQAIWHLGCMYARADQKEKALRQLRTVIAQDSSYAIGVRTEGCWSLLWRDADFLKVVGAEEKSKIQK